MHNQLIHTYSRFARLIHICGFHLNSGVTITYQELRVLPPVKVPTMTMAMAYHRSCNEDLILTEGVPQCHPKVAAVTMEPPHDP